MNLWLRLLAVLIASLFRPRLGLIDLSVLRFRVWPHDLDVNVHMNNARYLALMDLGRLDMIIRGKLWRTVLRERWQPVLAGSVVRYRRPLRPFQRFSLTSRLIAWDDRWIYMEHRVETEEGLSCQALMRGAFVGKNGVVPPSKVIEAAGFSGPSPKVPAWVESWRDLDTAFEQAPAELPVEQGEAA
ncbi:thioesterase family protein [Magnetospirillum molischianum]|uniref:Thioesterase superfamily n=1 Tax=Magnetospirillum molischianum DSM 120 TaxID=1150626 RepID=H8FSX6_MAGML|nr:thioesterase family protein [Magnetospirillum molischianum]CCG41464.1 Thioesterase superfamily [Magnetospirillum molischianum DSM 120]